MADLNDILNSSGELNKDQLMDYLSGNLSKEGMHTVEKQMADSDFINDAVEGLQSFSSPDKAGNIVRQLNTQLNQQLKGKKRKNKHNQPIGFFWAVIAIVIIIVLCLLAYFVIRM